MRTGTVSYRLEDLKNGVIIPIGFVGENDFTKVFFDAEEIYKKYPSASVSMKVQPPKGVIYPATVTRDGNTVIWQVKEADVANRGGGELQLTFTDGETKIKTYIAKTDVKRSLAGNGPAPDPVQDWVDNAEEVLDDLAAMDNIAKTALEGDIGKALSPKTVENGVVTEWQFVEPGAGTDDYADLDNKPSIAGVTLSGNKTLEDLGIASDDDLDNLADEVSDVKTAIDGIETSGEVTKTDYTGVSPYKNTNLEGKTISKLLNNNVSGILVISGKNIAEISGIDETITKNGKTLTVKSQADGSVLINGDYDAVTDTYISLVTDEYTIPSGTTYTISQNLDISDGVGIIYSGRGIQSGKKRTVTLTSDSLCNSSRNRIIIMQGTRHFDNVVFKAQAELGNTDTTWEKYDGKHVTAIASDAETSVNYKCGSTMVAIWNGNASVTLQTEEYEYIGYNGYANVLRKGAKGDGTTDDSDVLQDVINKNRKVYIPTGKYKLTKTITIPSNTEIMGDGELTELICLGTSSTLTPYEWSTDYGDDNYFYPYFVADNSENVVIRDIYIHGNLTTEDQHIHTGLCFYGSVFSVAERVKISRVNYFPANAPTPPSGQWRRGWGLSMFGCENIEIRNGDFSYSPYENVRVGRNCKNIHVHDCMIKYGWRTGLQVLRGCDNILVDNNVIIQDYFEAYDTRACITLHSAEDNHINRVTIKNNTLIGDLFIDPQQDTSAGISGVDYYCDNLVIDGNEIVLTGASVGVDVYGENITVKNNTIKAEDKYGVRICGKEGMSSRVVFENNKISSKNIGLHVYGAGTKEIIVRDNSITSSEAHDIYIGGNYELIVSIVAEGNKLISGDNTCHGLMSTSGTELSGAIVGNIAKGCDYGVRVLNGSGVVIVGNDLHDTERGLTVSGTGNVTGNNATP